MFFHNFIKWSAGRTVLIRCGNSTLFISSLVMAILLAEQGEKCVVRAKTV